MNKLFIRQFWLALAVSLPIVVSTPAWTQAAPTQAAPTQAASTQAASPQQPDSAIATPTWAAPALWFVYVVVGVVLLGSLVTLLLIRTALSNSMWSLTDALSEEVEVTLFETVDGVKKPVMDQSQKPLLITEMRASTSRVVALMGMIVIIMMFLGFGTFALYGFAITGNIPASIDKVVNFLVAGLTLFAPYVVNKFSTMFKSLSPKKA